jgi:hypothetical protein
VFPLPFGPVLAGLRLTTRSVAFGSVVVSCAFSAARAGGPIDVIQIGTQRKAIDRAVMFDVVRL